MDHREDEEGQHMGRHRRSAAGRAATGRAAETTPDAYGTDHPGSPGGVHGAEGSPAHPLYAPFDEPEAFGAEAPAGAAGEGPRVHHRRKRGVPVRAGLLGVSAAVALGAVAVTSGLIPGTDSLRLGGDHGVNKVRAAGSSPSVEAQGGTDGALVERSPSSASRDTERATPSKATPSKGAPSPSAPSKSASPTPSRTPSKKAEPSRTPSAAPSTKSASPSTSAPERRTPVPAVPAPAKTAVPSAAAQVVTLVNQERAKVGCSPVTSDSGLAALASDFSSDMAARDFFDHTDPDGATPWDRAKEAGITDLGGENIARGQADAQSVMDAWMSSAGHKANILNCDFKTIGVGVHFGAGGPWWTQDFGY
ncbi:CAP domain-containing protein [Streptomyces sp. NPDC050145]|uniref:CAP domain-containing protein n=1 Tax=Streptomyces sp. NPDC050145 TaxID=3365602 RepID=UPI00379AEA7D